MKPSVLLKTGDFITFYLSRNTFTRLTSMWNGRVVYQRHWHVFFQEMRADWLRMTHLVSSDVVRNRSSSQADRYPCQAMAIWL